MDKDSYIYRQCKGRVKSFFERWGHVDPLEKLAELVATSGDYILMAYEAYGDLYGLTPAIIESRKKLENGIYKGR